MKLHDVDETCGAGVTKLEGYMQIDEQVARTGPRDPFVEEAGLLFRPSRWGGRGGCLDRETVTKQSLNGWVLNGMPHYCCKGNRFDPHLPGWLDLRLMPARRNCCWIPFCD